MGEFSLMVPYNVSAGVLYTQKALLDFLVALFNK